MILAIGNPPSFARGELRLTGSVPIRPVSIRGFTLVELTIVLAIVGMIGLLNWAAMAGVSRRRAARAAAWQLKETFQSAREKAVLSDRPVALTRFVANSISYQSDVTSVIFYPDGTTNGAVVYFPADHQQGFEVRLESSGRLDVRQR